jgi:hypothetical protein
MIFPFLLGASQIPDYFSIGSGAFDGYRKNWCTAELDIEYKAHFNCMKSPFEFLEFRSLVGIMANARGAGYLYLGLNLDMLFFGHLLFAPGFAAGYYWQGSGKNLGYPIEFRSGIELAWQFKSLHRLGVHFYHLSNASMGKRNPGEESFILFYDIPIKKGFPFNNK